MLGDVGWRLIRLDEGTKIKAKSRGTNFLKFCAGVKIDIKMWEAQKIVLTIMLTESKYTEYKMVKLSNCTNSHYLCFLPHNTRPEWSLKLYT